MVGFAIEFESISLRLERVYKQAVKTYNAASTHSERNVAFDELTCILGEGLRPISGVTDWRAAGAPSFRRACLDILSSLQRIAELRLDLEEARLRWQGHPLRMPAPSADMVDARWTFSWGGRDLARIVLSSLDWLQAVPTVTDWYGRPFSFVANPLSLPLNLVDVYNQLGMEFKVINAGMPHFAAPMFHILLTLWLYIWTLTGGRTNEYASVRQDPVRGAGPGRAAQAAHLPQPLADKLRGARLQGQVRRNHTS